MSLRSKIVIAGVGGQGILFASKVLSMAAMNSGSHVVMSEVHGMAQRGGVVTCNLCIGDLHSSLIGDAEADIVFAFEPIEAYRALAKANSETRFVISTSKVVPVSVSIGAEAYPNIDSLQDSIREVTNKITAIDSESLAIQAGSHVTANSVLLGALAGSGDCPVEAEALKDALTAIVPPATAEMNIKAFELGMQAASDRISAASD